MLQSPCQNAEPVTVPVGTGDKLHVMNSALTRQLGEIAIAIAFTKVKIEAQVIQFLAE